MGGESRCVCRSPGARCCCEIAGSVDRAEGYADGGIRRSLTGHLQGSEGEAGGQQDGQISGLGHWVDGGVSCGKDEGYGRWETRGRYLLSLF